MDDLTSRFRSAYDTLMQNQPDPPQFESISVQTLQGSPYGSPRNQRTPLYAFVGGVAAITALGLALWIGGAWSERLPPRLNAESIDLEWRPAEGIGSDFERIEFATGSNGSLALAMSWSRENRAIAIDGMYRSENGIRWTEVVFDGFEGLDQLNWLEPYPDGYIASGTYRNDQESRPALWTSQNGADWDQIRLPLPDQDPEAIISYGVGPVARDLVEGFALGQFVVNRPAEGESPQFDDQGNPIPPDQGGFLWETDGSGTWHVADSAPDHPLFLADGPAGPILISSTDEGTSVWRRDGASWSQSATVPERAESLEVALVGNDTGYLMLFRDGQVWFSRNAIEWTPIDEPAFPSSEFDRPGLLSAGPGGFVVTSTASQTVSWSSNGTEWIELATADDLEIAAFLGAAAVHERAISLPVSSGSGESIQRFILTGTVSPDG